MRNFMLASVLGLVLVVGLANSQTTQPADPPATATATSTTKATSTQASKPVPTTKPTLQGAKWSYMRGYYDQAISIYTKLGDDPANAIEISIGLADAYSIRGKYAEAVKALEATQARGEKQADWQVAYSQALTNVGKYTEAVDAAKKAFELKGDWGPAIYTYGSALEMLGKKDQAKDVYKASEKIFAQANYDKDILQLVSAGQILDRYAVLTGKKASEMAQNILTNYYQKAYQQLDKTYWPANIAAAGLLLSKHKPAQAEEECRWIERTNQNHPDVSVCRGAIALEGMDFENTIKLADKALAINPAHADALLLKAACYMQWRKYEEVPPIVEKILAYNPNQIDALSMMAAAWNRLNKPEESAKFIKRVQDIDANNAAVYATLGQWLSAGRQFDDAEKNFKKAIELAPEQAGPVTDLGLLYMQTGQEDLAQETLKKAFALDDFRADVVNYLNLLEKIGKFQVKETAHFIVKVDTKDEVLLDYLAGEAERLNADVTKDFGYTPTHKTVLEIFPSQEGFAVRLTGRGWLPTVGACTGRVIAMPSPDPLRNGNFGTFNWSVVLRHEYTHAVTLSMTENRISHWFTEACAVWEQPDRRNFEAVNLLVMAVRNNTLFPVKDLDWGFIRPKKPTDRSQAYAQSEWIFEYVVEKKGYDAILQMLAGYRDRMTQKEIFQKVLGVSEEQFDKDFLAWARKQVAEWGFDGDPNPDIDAAQKAVNDNPKDADALATLALAYSRKNQPVPAEAAAKKALDIDAQNKKALRVLAWSYMIQKKEKESLEAAARLESVEPNSWLASRIKAESYLAKRQWPQAIAALESYKQRLRFDPYSYEKLAGLYMQLGQTENALPDLIELHRCTVKDPKYARQIADIYRTAGQAENALKFYDEIIHINPYDATAYKAMAGLYLQSNHKPEAVQAMHAATLLEPESVDTWTQMALVCFRVYKSGKSLDMGVQARAAAEKAIRLDGNNTRAREVLQTLNEELPPTATVPAGME